MKRLIQALSEYFEAHAEHVREATATMQLGVYARGYQEGREDIMETYGFEVAFIGADDDDDDDSPS
jgi:hypothetical protein